MSGGGWFKIWRSIETHPIVGYGKPVRPHKRGRGAYSKNEAFKNLLGRACFAPQEVSNMGRQQRLDRGQALVSRGSLAREWNWTEKTVRVFLDTLVRERMIARVATKTSENGQRNGQQKSNEATVIQICNYDRYQGDNAQERESEGPAQRPARGQRRASEGPHIRKKRRKEISSSASAKGGRSSATISEEDIDAAFAAYNEAARKVGGLVAEMVTRARRRDLAKRLAEIGGIEVWRRAMAAVERDDLLSGRLPGVNGGPPFQLTLEGLLSTRSPDFLARLIDLSASANDSANATLWWKDPARVAALSDDDWRKLIAEHANGCWAGEKIGPSPASGRSVVPQHIIEEMNLIDRYTEYGLAKGTH